MSELASRARNVPPATAQRTFKISSAFSLRILRLFAAASFVLSGGEPAAAKVVGIEITERSDVLDGVPFGGLDVGGYERLEGIIHFAFDPINESNSRITDLMLAPRNADGLVEASANFIVLRPKSPPANHVAYVEVSNRGGQASLSYFNGGSRRDPYGDGLLMRQGLTVIWVGWQWDVPERPGILRLNAPIATHDDGSAIRGLVRADWVVERPTTTLDLGHRNHVAYPAVDPDDERNVLTVRDGRAAPRITVPRDTWRFARELDDGSVVDDPTHVYLAQGFDPGRIYECVYLSEEPRVVGLGPAAIRDVMSYVKYDESCPFPADKGMALGISQTGRFLRTFLYQGFNTDERGRKVYDGLFIHTAGAGRGSFNHRFAQPSRDAHRFSAFFYPTDIFPFTSRSQTDPVTGDTDGLAAHQFNDEHLPKVFYTNSGYEYWGRAAGLIHTSVDGSRDVEPLSNERIYHLSSTQHFPVGIPRQRSRIGDGPGYRGDPVDLLAPLRALLVRMIEWVQDDPPAAPPDSRMPRVAEGTLVPIDEMAWPAIPGLALPGRAHEAYRMDHGGRFQRSMGVVERQPPARGPAFPVLVPQVDAIGNERAGVPTVETLVPLATYLPWNLRHGMPGPEEELTDFYGTFVPLPATETARTAAGDPRPSVESLYDSREAYLRQVNIAIDKLVNDGFLLDEDRPRALGRAQELWDRVVGQ